MATKLEPPAPVPPVVGEARKTIEALMADGEVSAELVASRLGLAYQGLQVRLARHRTTYLALLCSVRREVAVAQLTRTRAPLGQVTAATGFKSQDVFRRWFKRQFDCSPTAFRAENSR